jgi:hypothetical protein
MKGSSHKCGFKPQECFRLRFQRRLADYHLRQGSAAEGFGVVWEKTLEEVPVDDAAQGRLYRQLIDWARHDKLFTGSRQSRVLTTEQQAFHDS